MIQVLKKLLIFCDTIVIFTYRIYILSFENLIIRIYNCSIIEILLYYIYFEKRLLNLFGEVYIMIFDTLMLLIFILTMTGIIGAIPILIVFIGNKSRNENTRLDSNEKIFLR